MKKILSLSLILTGVLAFSACSLFQSETEKGEAWAKENGYVKDEKLPENYGKYELAYVNDGDSVFTSCACEELGYDYQQLCSKFSKSKFYIEIKDKLKIVVDGKVKKTLAYKIVDNEIYVDYNKTGIYEEYKEDDIDYLTFEYGCINLHKDGVIYVLSK